MWRARRLVGGECVYDSTIALQEGRNGLDAVRLARGCGRRVTWRLVEQLFSWSLAGCDVAHLEPRVRHWLLVFPFSVAAAFD